MNLKGKKSRVLKSKGSREATFPGFEFRRNSQMNPERILFGQVYKERRADALAMGADERRSKLRKAVGSRKQAVIRRYLNGETYTSRPRIPCCEYITVRREPGELKHLSSRRKRKQQ